VFEEVMPDPFATAPNLRGNWLTCVRIIMASGSSSPARENPPTTPSLRHSMAKVDCPLKARRPGRQKRQICVGAATAMMGFVLSRKLIILTKTIDFNFD
jgi:hypothetical protein